MPFNEQVAAQQEAARVARVQSTPAGAVVAAQQDARSGRTAGGNDGSGNWTGHGRLDYTTFGDGFKLS